MVAEQNPSGGFLTGAAVFVGLCCGLPLLLGSGIALGVAGVALGSGLLVAVGVAVGVWAWHRRQRAACETDTSNARYAHEPDRY
jgi:hypothetical protein